MFGHLEKPFFLELCRFMETINLKAGQFLFKVGDPDDSIFVVQQGMLEFYILDSVRLFVYSCQFCSIFMYENEQLQNVDIVSFLIM